jgi:type I restriction enzyme S subunit
LAAEGGARGVAVNLSKLARWGLERSALVKSVPAGWRIVKFREFLRQCVARVSVKDDAEYRLFGVKWYGEGVFERETCLGANLSASHLYPLGSGRLIYNRLFAWKASFAVVPDSADGLYVSNEFPQFEVDPSQAIAEYVLLYCLSDPFIAAVKKASEGSAAVSRNRFKEGSFLDFEISLPPLLIQQSIVTHWQTLQAQAQQAQALADQCEAKGLEAFLCALGLQNASAGVKRKGFALSWSRIGRWGVDLNQPGDKLNVAAGRYPVVTLGEVIADLANGWSPKCLDRPAQGSEWGVLKLGAVSFGAFNAQENKALPPSLQPVPALEIQPGDWLISRANITRLVGACALVKDAPHRLMLCDKIFRAVWRADAPALPAYLDEVLKTAHLRQQIEGALTGTSPTMKNISKPSLLALRLPLPPLDIQKSLVAAIHDARAEAARLRTEAARLRQQARQDIEAALLGQPIAGGEV